MGFYCKELDYIIIFPKKPTQKTELIITANGNPEYFTQVTELIKHAPTLKHWKFTAFIQPTANIDEIMDGLDEPYIFPEITLKTSDIKFLPLAYDEKIKKTRHQGVFKKLQHPLRYQNLETSNLHHYARPARRKSTIPKY